MTYIKNNKTLVAIIAILFLSNVVLLYFFIRKCDKDGAKKPPPENFRKYMVRILRDTVGFNDQQVAQYEQLSNKHKEVMKPMFEVLRQTKDSLYSQLQIPVVSDTLTNYYLDKIGERQKNIDQKIFNHFLTLREICTAEQRPKFDTFMQRTAKKMIGKR
jgi:periplasmic protein CpxP/Spy